MRQPLGQPPTNDNAEMTMQKCRVQNAECRVQNAECRMQSAECRVQNAECRMQSAECRMQNHPCFMRCGWDNYGGNWHVNRLRDGKITGRHR